MRLSVGFTGHYFASIEEMQQNTTVGHTSTTKEDFQRTFQQWQDCLCTCVYRVSQEECVRLPEGIPYVKVY